MSSNLFGKLFQFTILFLLLAELVSLLAQFFPWLNQAAFIVIVFVAFILALCKLESGLYVLLAELFVGGLGYLFVLDFNGIRVSLRIGLFLAVFIAWLWVMGLEFRAQSLPRKIASPDMSRAAPRERSRGAKRFIRGQKFKLSVAYLLVAIIILFGSINGWLNNRLANVFFDANGWFYFALIPVFWRVLAEEKIRENVLQILIGATGFLAAKTLGTLFLFSHNLASIGGIFYDWIRDTRLGEITYVSGAIFRVFFQSQIYCLIGFFVVLAILIGAKEIQKKDYFFLGLYLYLTSLAVVISQSRSFWVGGLAGLFFLLVFVFWRFDFRLKKTAALVFVLALALVSQIFLVNLLTGNLSGNLIASRFDNLPAEPAGQSRLSQLGPLSQAIAQKPLFGYGFGKTLTYQSQDPRVLKNNPDGRYTTYAFEWGYLDIALKVGLIGLAVYLGLIASIFYQGLNSKFSAKGGCTSGCAFGAQSLNSKHLNIGLLLGLIALVVTNIFSPYLNHPLGIAYIMLVSALNFSEKNK